MADASAKTHTAADRPLYARLLADAAVVLASAVRGTAESDLLALLRAHDRMRSYAWLEGPEHQAVSTAWETVLAQAPTLRNDVSG